MKLQAFYYHQLYFILGEMSDTFDELQRCDEHLQKNVTQLLFSLYDKFRNPQSSREILLGGSTIEGAMLARFFKNNGTKDVNEEVEVDFNIVVADIPLSHRYLVEDVTNKEGKVKIRNVEELYQLITNEVGFIIIYLP